VLGLDETWGATAATIFGGSVTSSTGDLDPSEET
jgi:hypothetical protein